MAAINRANHACIRLNPVWGPDHEAVIRFCGQGSEAAGPFSQRHCSHSRMRIAATSDRHRLSDASSAVSAEPCLSFLVLECCSRRRTQLDTVRHLAGRDEAPQRNQKLARQRHDHCRLACAARPFGSRAVPARQRTVFLEYQEAPRQLDQPTSHPRIAGLGQALLSTFQTAFVGRSREPSVARHVLAIALANKLARIAWSVLARGRDFEVRKIDEVANQSA